MDCKDPVQLSGGIKNVYWRKKTHNTPSSSLSYENCSNLSTIKEKQYRPLHLLLRREANFPARWPVVYHRAGVFKTLQTRKQIQIYNLLPFLCTISKTKVSKTTHKSIDLVFENYTKRINTNIPLLYCTNLDRRIMVLRAQTKLLWDPSPSVPLGFNYVLLLNVSIWKR